MLKKRIEMNMDLFGRKCLIPTGISEKPFVYRIVSSGTRSNSWSEVPLTYNSERNPVLHTESCSILFVVLDSIISDKSKIIRVAENDVELISNDKWTFCDDELPEEWGTYQVAWKPRNNSKKCYQEILEFDSDERKWEEIPQSIPMGGAEIVAWMRLPDMPTVDE